MSKLITGVGHMYVQPLALGWTFGSFVFSKFQYHLRNTYVQARHMYVQVGHMYVQVGHTYVLSNNASTVQACIEERRF